MAVYTKLDQGNIEKILSNYSIGKLDKFEGIEEGIENSNFLIWVDKKKYILTVYEKRVKKEDLPFFSELMSSLNNSNLSQKPSRSCWHYGSITFWIYSFNRTSW